MSPNSSKPTEQQRLKHMLVAIEKVFRYTQGMDEEEYLQNEMVQDAVMKNFEVLGEASYHLPKELKGRYVDIEWREIEGFRHVLVHDYYKINAKRLWNTKEQFLLVLEQKLKMLVENEF